MTHALYPSHLYLDTKLDPSRTASTNAARKPLGRPLTGAAGAALRRKAMSQTNSGDPEVLVRPTSTSRRREATLRVGSDTTNEDDYIDIAAEIAAIEAACAAAASSSSSQTDATADQP